MQEDLVHTTYEHVYAPDSTEEAENSYGFGAPYYACSRSERANIVIPETPSEGEQYAPVFLLWDEAYADSPASAGFGGEMQDGEYSNELERDHSVPPFPDQGSAFLAAGASSAGFCAEMGNAENPNNYDEQFVPILSNADWTRSNNSDLTSTQCYEDISTSDETFSGRCDVFLSDSAAPTSPDAQVLPNVSSQSSHGEILRHLLTRPIATSVREDPLYQKILEDLLSTSAAVELRVREGAVAVHGHAGVSGEITRPEECELF